MNLLLLAEIKLTGQTQTPEFFFENFVKHGKSRILNCTICKFLPIGDTLAELVPARCKATREGIGVF